MVAQVASLNLSFRHHGGHPSLVARPLVWVCVNGFGRLWLGFSGCGWVLVEARFQLSCDWVELWRGVGGGWVSVELWWSMGGG